MTSAPTSVHDSSRLNDREQAQLDNLADQLRTVHFTLLVLCLVLLAATLQEHRNPFPRALDDLKAIIGFVSETDISKKITERVQKKSNDQNFQMGRPLFVRVKVQGMQEFYKLTFDAPWAYQDYKARMTSAGVFILDPDSLRDFASFWNHNKEQHLYLIGKIKNPAEIEASETRNIRNRKGPIQQVAFTVDLNDWILTGSTEKVSFWEMKKAQSAPTIPLQAEWENDQLVLRTYDYNQLSSADFEIRPHVTPLNPNVNIQDMLRAAAGKTDEWILGDFAETFPDLNQAGGKLAAMPLRDLQQELNRQSTDQEVRDAENLEIFGAKIPVKQVSNWGIVLLAGAQFYLWLYLNALRRLVQASDLRLSMSWIGLHEGLSSRSFVLFSVLVLPLGVVGMLVYRGWNASTWVRILYVMGTSISFLLVSLTTATLSRIWKPSKP